MTDNVLIPRGQVEDLANMVKEQTLMMLEGLNTPAITAVQELMARLRIHNPDAARLVYTWWGRNHQRIQPGDTARWTDVDGDTYPCEVIECYVFGALVEDGFEYSWRPWCALHRLDRLHTEPDFDVSSWPAIAARMGYATDETEAAGHTPLYLRPRLVVIPGGVE